MALSARRGRDRDRLHQGRGMNNFRRARELVDRFRTEFGGITCEELQLRFAGRTYDLWNPEEYSAFTAARGDQCARATATVTRWVIEMI